MNGIHLFQITNDDSCEHGNELLSFFERGQVRN
jgi:hypothetical protein